VPQRSDGVVVARDGCPIRCARLVELLRNRPVVVPDVPPTPADDDNENGGQNENDNDNDHDQKAPGRGATKQQRGGGTKRSGPCGMSILAEKLEDYLRRRGGGAAGSGGQKTGKMSRRRGKEGEGKKKTPAQLFYESRWFGDSKGTEEDAAGLSSDDDDEEEEEPPQHQQDAAQAVTLTTALKRHPKGRGGVLAGCRSVLLRGSSTEVTRF
jgi:hypothetical protein